MRELSLRKKVIWCENAKKTSNQVCRKPLFINVTFEEVVLFDNLMSILFDSLENRNSFHSLAKFDLCRGYTYFPHKPFNLEQQMILMDLYIFICHMK
jgi:hypothetical protein